MEEGPPSLQRVLAALEQASIPLHDAGIRRPTLDDVFLTLTGHDSGAENESELSA